MSTDWNGIQDREVRIVSEREYTQHDAMKYANVVHDALMHGMRERPKPLPFSLHSFMCYVNYKNNCYKLNVTAFTYERYMSLIYSESGYY